jgi:hypothetical protein
VGFSRQNWPKDAVLSMDCNPLQLDLGARIVGGHLKVDRQLPDGILPPRRASVEDTHDDSLQKMLGKFHVTEDVLRSMVNQNSIRNSVDDCAHLIPPINLCWHRKQWQFEDDVEGVGGEFEHNTWKPAKS